MVQQSGASAMGFDRYVKACILFHYILCHIPNIRSYIVIRRMSEDYRSFKVVHHCLVEL